MKPIRSVLYTPGSRGDLIEKAPNYGADALCLVLEDSVPEDLKEEARQTAAEMIPRLAERGQTLFVKVNSLDSNHLETDLTAIVGDGLSGVIVPEARAVDDVHQIASLLTEVEAAKGLNTGAVEILLLIETAGALQNAYGLASASPRVRAVISGHGKNGDMARDLGYRWTPDGMERLYLRSKILTDSRAAGCHPMDGVYMHVDDSEGLVREAELSRQLGYGGKLAVAPRQVEVINRTFTPTESEVERHQKLVDEFEAALREGSASYLARGEFVDYAPYETAKAALELARVVGVRPD